MAEKEFIKGEKYTEEEYIELSIAEMNKSQSEHTDRADPKVGACIKLTVMVPTLIKLTVVS